MITLDNFQMLVCAGAAPAVEPHDREEILKRMGTLLADFAILAHGYNLTLSQIALHHIAARQKELVDA
jgi:hypothetical protein